MTFFRNLSIIAGVLSVIGGSCLAYLKVLDIRTIEGFKVLGVTVPLIGSLLYVTSVVTVVVVILYVLMSILLIIGIFMNRRGLILTYLCYAGVFFVIYSLMYVFRYFTTTLVLVDHLRYVIPIGSLVCFLFTVTIYYIDMGQVTEEKKKN